MKRATRRIHRWIGVFVAIPSVIVLSTGLLLQFKKQAAWIQPPTLRGSSSTPELSWHQLLEIAKTDPNSTIDNWEDIDRLDVRPSKGVIKVRSKDRWEIQIDAATGQVLSSAYRRSDLIESLHDGSFFSDYVKLFVFSANGAGLVVLLVSGLYLWYLPVGSKKNKAKRLKQKGQQQGPERLDG